MDNCAVRISQVSSNWLPRDMWQIQRLSLIISFKPKLKWIRSGNSHFQKVGIHGFSANKQLANVHYRHYLPSAFRADRPAHEGAHDLFEQALRCWSFSFI